MSYQVMQELNNLGSILTNRIARNRVKEHSTKIEFAMWDGIPYLPHSLLMDGWQFDNLVYSMTGKFTVYMTVGTQTTFCGGWTLETETDHDLLVSFLSAEFEALWKQVL